MIETRGGMVTPSLSVARGGGQPFGDEARNGVDMAAKAARADIPYAYLAPVIGGAYVQDRGGMIDLTLIFPIGLVHDDLAGIYNAGHHRDMSALQTLGTGKNHDRLLHR